jgi:hypothetical protein
VIPLLATPWADHCSEADVLRALNVQMLRFQVNGNR